MAIRCYDMTDTQQYSCPIDDCNYSAGSKGSVVGHISRKTSEGHGGKSGPQYRDEIETVSVDSDGNSDANSEQETVNSEQTVTFPDAEQSASTGTVSSDSEPMACCSDPDLEGEAGAVYQLDDGSYVRLEEGDEICLNCDHIHE